VRPIFGKDRWAAAFALGAASASSERAFAIPLVS
jgi:hypothetical protein